MEIKFDVYFKKNLGTLFKNNEVDLNGLPARTNLQLVLVDRLEINYKVGSNKYTDIVTITDATENLIQIPFKSDVVKVGLNEFEIVAYMKNGDIKTSQTYTYNIDEAIGEGRQTGSGGSSDGHTHNNLNVLNSITQSKVSEWNNKADSTHSHSEYASKSHNHNEYANVTHTHSNYASATHSHSEYANNNHTHNASEIEGLENVNIDLSDYYTKSETYNRTEIDNKIANMGTGGSVDLSNYYTKSETDEVINNKADKVHTHSEYLTELPTHEHSEYLTEHQDISHKADKLDTYTKTQTDNKISEEIAKAQLGGDNEVDLSAYATKNYVDDEISKIELKEGPQGPQGPKGDKGDVGPQGPAGTVDTSNFYNKEEVDKKFSELSLSGGVAFRDIFEGEIFSVEEYVEEDTPDMPPVVVPPEEEPPIEEEPPATVEDEVNTAVINVNGIEYFKVKNVSYIKSPTSNTFLNANSYKNDKYQLYGFINAFNNQLDITSDDFFNGLIRKSSATGSNSLLNDAEDGVCYAVVNNAIVVRLPLDLDGHSNSTEYIKANYDEFYLAKKSSCTEIVINPSLITSMNIKLNDETVQYAQFGYSDSPTSNIYSGICSIGFNTGSNANLTSSGYTPCCAMSTTTLAIRFNPGTFEEFTLDNVKTYLEKNTLKMWI